MQLNSSNQSRSLFCCHLKSSMNLTLKLDVEDGFSRENVSCHMLPCSIKLNGFSKVSKYFAPHIREDENTYTCSFRGYPLQGQKVKVPDGYSGVILRERKHVDSDERELKATATFSEFTYWNWDKMPSADDKLVKALEWINIASVLHKPLSGNGDSKSVKSPQKQRKRKLSE